MELSVVLFDLDGTLTDSVPLIVHTYEIVFRELGLVWQPVAVTGMIGLPLRSIARTFAGERDREFLSLYQQHYLRDHDRLMRSFPWTENLLDSLGGLRLGVVTSKGRGGTDRTLSFTGLASRFEVVVTAEDTPTHKPDPGPVLFALEAVGVQAEAAAYVGDSPFDIQAGRSAGTLTAGVTWGASPGARLADSGADAVFDHWRDLAGFLNKGVTPCISG
ncbi:MAG: HAD-IA family hydrolase [Peptococcaceae bacterium]|nr:HAD-IA family hydrolase [Peptococcaceae bacterium]